MRGVIVANSIPERRGLKKEGVLEKGQSVLGWSYSVSVPSQIVMMGAIGMNVSIESLMEV